jgi:phenylpropionate dioxygenase-like ring-hydroxylating dioxygenase large terminal subunit
MIVNNEPANAMRHPDSDAPAQPPQTAAGAPVQLAVHHLRRTPRDLRKTGLCPDYWYPLARSGQVERGKTLGVSFAGEPIVLARSEQGNVFALENRCAHRQIPLEDGVVRGELLQCCYHGWTYDSTGACVGVPYLDKAGRLPNGVRSYPCREAYGLIFVFPGNRARLDEARFPQIPNHGERDYKTRYLDRSIACHYSFMHENLMDMNHQFLHRRLMRTIKAKLLDIRTGDGWVEVDYTFHRESNWDPFYEKMIGRRRAPTEGRERDIMTIRTEYPYQTLRFWRMGNEHPALDLWNVYVPVDREQRTNRTFGLMMLRKPSTPGLLQAIWPIFVWFTNSIFKEDQWIVEKEQQAFDAQGADWNNEISPQILQLRELLADCGVPLSAGQSA